MMRKPSHSRNRPQQQAWRGAIRALQRAAHEGSYLEGHAEDEGNTAVDASTEARPRTPPACQKAGRQPYPPRGG